MPKTKKRVMKKKRGTKRRVMRVPRALVRTDYSTVISFDYYATAFGNDTTLITRGALTASLSQIPDYTNYTAIWDQYRIDKVEFKFVPTLSTVINKPYDDSTSVLVVDPCQLVIAIDRDDNSLPSTSTGYVDLLKRAGSKTCRAGKTLTVTWKPNRLKSLYQSATSTGYAVDNSNEFLDCAQTSIPHYGLKYALTPFSPPNCFQYMVKCRYWVSFGNRRN